MVFRGNAEAEAARRSPERQVADEPSSPAPLQLTATQLRKLCEDRGADDKRGHLTPDER
jgi:hypothetical protein